MIFYTVAGADAMFVDQGSVVAGSVLIGTAAGEAGSLAPGTDGQVLTVDTGVPEGLSWVTPITAAHEHNTPNTVAVEALKWDSTFTDESTELIDTDTFLAQSSVSTPPEDPNPDPVWKYPFVALWEYINNKLIGFTAKPDGSLPVLQSNQLTLLAPGTNGYVLLADSTEAAGVKWADTGSLPTPTSTPPPQVDMFVVNGTWTKPAGAKVVQVLLIGGGGGGGGSAAAATVGYNSAGGGGGAGGRYEAWFEADDVPASMSVTIGSGGTAASAANGGQGGTTVWGSGGGWPTAVGGMGGLYKPVNSVPIVAMGGQGGTWTGPTGPSLDGIGISGQYGGAGWGVSGEGLGGRGGSGPYGAGGPESEGSGIGGTQYGAGGGGSFGGMTSGDAAAPPRSGAPGTSGLCIVTTYF